MPHFGWVVEKSKEYADKCRENAQQPEIACADGENAAEEKDGRSGMKPGVRKQQMMPTLMPRVQNMAMAES